MKKSNSTRTRKSGRNVVTSAKTTELLQTKVIATNKAKGMRPTGFFGIMAVKATRPITVQNLVSAMKNSATVRSKKDNSTVAHVKVRDAFTRLGLLKKAA